jgi:uncharacterized protein HemY
MNKIEIMFYRVCWIFLVLVVGIGLGYAWRMAQGG